MKQLLKTIIRNVKSVRGNSLAEFATTTALMATLAATAAPKLSEMSEGAKGEKSRNEIDKIVKMAGQFYQDVADTEGRGRFPNQVKFNAQIGGALTYDNAGGSTGDLADAKENSKNFPELTGFIDELCSKNVYQYIGELIKKDLSNSHYHLNTEYSLNLTQYLMKVKEWN